MASRLKDATRRAPFADMEALKAAVMASARDLMGGDVRNAIIDFRYRIDAENEAGELVYTLPFRHAVNIIPESASVASGFHA